MQFWQQTFDYQAKFPVSWWPGGTAASPVPQSLYVIALWGTRNIICAVLQVNRKLRSETSSSCWSQEAKTEWTELILLPLLSLSQCFSGSFSLECIQIRHGTHATFFIQCMSSPCAVSCVALLGFDALSKPFAGHVFVSSYRGEKSLCADFFLPLNKSSLFQCGVTVSTITLRGQDISPLTEISLKGLVLSVTCAHTQACIHTRAVLFNVILHLHDC